MSDKVEELVEFLHVWILEVNLKNELQIYLEVQPELPPRSRNVVLKYKAEDLLTKAYLIPNNILSTRRLSCNIHDNKNFILILLVNISDFLRSDPL